MAKSIKHSEYEQRKQEELQGYENIRQEMLEQSRRLEPLKKALIENNLFEQFEKEWKHHFNQGQAKEAKEVMNKYCDRFGLERLS